MTQKKPVKTLLKLAETYCPQHGLPVTDGWKTRLLFECQARQTLTMVLNHRRSPIIWGLAFALPFLCLLIVGAVYTGLLPASIGQAAAGFDFPTVGLTETLIFTCTVSSLTLLFNRRVFSYF